MTLPVYPNAISFQQVNIEKSFAANTELSMDSVAMRTMFGIPSGQISMADGHGKNDLIVLTVNQNQQNFNLRTFALNNGWNEISAIQLNIATGVYVWSDSTSLPALTVSGTYPKGVSIVNRGYIIGKGGAGSSGSVGGSGGPAISIESPITIDNTYAAAYIAGGGGGGGGMGGGGGAGGGAGGTGGGGYAGGAGGGLGQVGSNGAAATSRTTTAGGGGGGRILPGVGGSSGSYSNYPETYGRGGGAGGGGGVITGVVASQNGNGGSGNSVGQNSTTYVGSLKVAIGGGGGGWGASGGYGAGTSNTPGAGGKAVATNGHTVTWISNDTTRVYGAVS